MFIEDKTLFLYSLKYLKFFRAGDTSSLYHLNNNTTEGILEHAFTNRFEAHGRTQLKHMAGRKAVHDGDDNDGVDGHCALRACVRSKNINVQVLNNYRVVKKSK